MVIREFVGASFIDKTIFRIIELCYYLSLATVLSKPKFSHILILQNFNNFCKPVSCSMSDYIFNLIKHVKSTQNKNCKETFKMRQKELADKAWWINKRYTDTAWKFIEEFI